MDAGTQQVGIAIGDFFKAAEPHEEGGRRFIYCVPSLETRDQERDRILKAALLWSRDFFLTKGNLDIEHLTVLGHRLGVANPYEWEIGVPLEVRDSPEGLFVKGEIAAGADKADFFWKSLTTRTPPIRWFPSVYGMATPDGKKTVWDTEARKHTTVITKAMWRGIGFAKEPINLSVPAASITPIGAFVKSYVLAESQPACVGDDCACELTKALTAGTGTPAGGTDSGQLRGGAALREQSLDGHVHDYWTPGNQAKAAKYLRSLGTKNCAHTGRDGLTRDTMHAHFTDCEGLEPKAAEAVTTRLLAQARERMQRAA